MSRFHPRQIEHARHAVVTHDPSIPSQRARTRLVLQWLILRESRPMAEAPEGELLAFPARPCWPPVDPLTPCPGGIAA